MREAKIAEKPVLNVPFNKPKKALYINEVNEVIIYPNFFIVVLKIRIKT